MMNQNYPDAAWLRFHDVLTTVHTEAEDLGQYVYTLLTAGTAQAARAFPDLQAHLATCADCRGDLAEMTAVVQGELEPLAGPVKPPGASVREQVGQAAARLYQLIFPAPHPQAGPSWLAQPTLGQSAPAAKVETKRRGHRQPLPGGDGWLRAVAAPNEASCLIEVEVTDSTDEPRPDLPVELSLAAEQEPRRLTTDEYGLVTFLDVPPDALDTASVRVQPSTGDGAA